MTAKISSPLPLRRRDQARRFSILIASVFILLGLVLWTAWNTAPDFYQLLTRDVILLQMHTLIGTALSGVALLLYCLPFRQDSQQQRVARVFARIAATAVILIGALTLAVNIPGVEAEIARAVKLLHIDAAIFHDGMMVPLNAICFIFAGMSLLLLDVADRKGRYPAEYFAIVLICINCLLLIGYLYDLTTASRFIPFATATAQAPIMFLMLASALLLARPEHHLMSVFLSKAPGGHLLRHLLPKTLLLLTALNLLAEWGAGQGFYGHDKVSPMVIAVDCTVLFVLFWRAAFLLNHEYEVRRQGEAALAKTSALLAVVSDSTMDPIFVKDRAGRFLFANPATLELIGRNSADVLGRRSSDVVTYAEDVTAIDEHDNIVLQSGRAQAFEEIVHAPRGTRIFHVTRAPWHDENGEIAGIVGIATDITERKVVEDAMKAHEMQLEELVATRTAEVSELVGHLESTREEEKRALARELHDDLGSSLTALNMHLAILFQKIATDPKITERISQVKALLNSVTATTRRIQSGLRPDKLDIFGIKTAIAEQALDFENYTGVTCRASLPDEEIAYGPQMEISLFRMVQEALNNIAKHAKASAVDVILDDNDEFVILTIRDNGIGMPERTGQRSTTHGLRGMRERASYLGGKIEIVSAPSQGTRIRITIPKSSARLAGVDMLDSTA